MYKQLQLLLSKVKPFPKEWYSDKPNGKQPDEPEEKPVELVECSSYAELVEAWRDETHEGGKKGALHWTIDIDITFSFMLAIVASTKQQGAQLWGRVIGKPGSAKTSLCEAIGANRDYCKNWSKFTGLHSGDSKVADEDKNINQIQNKTNIINEGAMIVEASKEVQSTILSELRDIWSGIIRADYKNGEKQDKTGIRSTWIIAGTNSLRTLNREQMGDRFLDSIIYKDDNAGSEEEDRLLDTIADIALDDVFAEHAEDDDKQDSTERRLAVSKTVGFVKYLRENTGRILATQFKRPPKEVKQSFRQLAQLVAYMRVRSDTKTEVMNIESELGTRLTAQITRLAVCMAVVLGKKEVDDEVMWRVACIANDTCTGMTYNVVKSVTEKPRSVSAIAATTRYSEEKVRHSIEILHQIKCVRADNTKTAGSPGKATGLWRLSPQVVSLLKHLNVLLSKGEQF